MIGRQYYAKKGPAKKYSSASNSSTLQVELRENAQRQAAEAENESNRRLAECAEMDGKR